MQAEVDAKLIAARKRPLTDWSASWVERAVALRDALKTASDEPVYGTWTERSEGPFFLADESERDLLLDSIGKETEQLAKVQGDAVAIAFRKAVTTEKITLREAADAWLPEVERSRRRKTAEGHRRVLGLLEEFLRERHGLLSLASTTFDEVTRRIAGEGIVTVTGSGSEIGDGQHWGHETAPRPALPPSLSRRDHQPCCLVVPC
ncbi:MAG TPA: hypothetical protein VKI44_01225, partial [Acetobacteraceae bacterium]|nr:hypothetical protein [Acetobacteraceae bacterium]